MPATLRVLLTTDVVGGVWDFSTVLAREIVRAGHRVTLLAFGDPSPIQHQQADQAGARLLAAPLKLEWMQDSAADLQRSRRLIAEIVRADRPDLLHVNQFGVVPAGIDLPVVMTAHSDVLSWQKWTASEPSAAWSAYRTLVRRGLERADAAVAVSAFVARDLRALYRLRRPIEVIPNGWPTPRLPPMPFAARARQTLIAGRIWDRAKNIDLACRSAAGWAVGQVLLAGSQRHPETGVFAHVDPAITAIGFQPRETIDWLLQQSRVYLAPARYEPFGLLPLQAALAGCVLLLSDIPSFREIWGDAAWYFRSNDADDLRRQWRRLLDDEPFAAALARRAYQRAVSSYSAATCAGRYLAIYQNLASRVGRAVA